MTDPLIALLYLKELESSPKGLTTDNLHSLLGKAGYEPPALRTVQRDIEELRHRGFKFKRNGKRYQFSVSEGNLRPFLEFFRDLMAAKTYRNLFFGYFEVRHALDYFSGREGLAAFFFKLIDAVRNSKMVTYDYVPQTELTRRRMAIRKKYKSTDDQRIPVKLLPHRIVTSGSSFLILGEYYEKGSFNINHYMGPRRRQYELKGISNLDVGKPEEPQLKIDPEELYSNSVQVWVDGKIHDIIIEDISVPDPAKKIITRKVNGEDEILSYTVASLGKIKIVNPPPELIKRATTIGLPQDLIFRFV